MPAYTGPTFAVGYSDTVADWTDGTATLTAHTTNSFPRQGSRGIPARTQRLEFPAVPAPWAGDTTIRTAFWLPDDAGIPISAEFISALSVSNWSVRFHDPVDYEYEGISGKLWVYKSKLHSGIAGEIFSVTLASPFPSDDTGLNTINVSKTVSGTEIREYTNPAAIIYDLNVANDIDSVTTTVDPTNSNATVVITGAAAGVTTLIVGSNEVVITVTAYDGVTTAVYIISVNRAAAMVVPETGDDTEVAEEFEAVVAISNAQLMELDKTYVELIPAPGKGKYIEVVNSWLTVTGDNVPDITGSAIELSASSINVWSYFGYFYIKNKMAENPLYSEDIVQVDVRGFGNLLRSNTGIYGSKIGAQPYEYDSPLLAGVVFANIDRTYGESSVYSAAAYDDFIAPVLDKSFSITLRYHILSSITTASPRPATAGNVYFLVVEDGRGLSNSNSYVSVDFADQYFLARGMSNEWTGEASEKASKLIVAAAWLDGAFLWRGTIMKKAQAMSFPRDGMDAEGRYLIKVPEAIKFAQCELALHYSKGELDRTFDYHGRVEEIRVGPITQKFSSVDRSGTSVSTGGISQEVEFTYVKRLLSNYTLPDDTAGPDAPSKFVEVTFNG